MLGEKHDHLTRYLELRHVRIQVDSVETLEVEHDMTIEEVVDIARLAPRASHPQQTSSEGIMTAPAETIATRACVRAGSRVDRKSMTATIARLAHHGPFVAAS